MSCSFVPWFVACVLALPAFAGTAFANDAAPADKPTTTAKPPYPVAHDAPLDAEERIVERAPKYTKLRVEFNGIRKDRVPGFLYVPKDGRKSHPGVLLQYGSGGHKGTFYIVALAEQFVGKGFVVLTIDAPYKGERKPKQPRDWKSMFADQGRFMWYCGDYSRAVDYLVTRPDVDPDRIGYAGVSWGAITGITFVAHDPRVRAMASIVGGGNFMGVISDKVEMPQDVVAIARSFDPVYHVADISPRPLLLMNVTKDQLVPRFFAESLHAAAGQGAKKVWIETDHFFQGVDRYAVLDDVIQFMLDGLPEREAGAATGQGS